MYSLLIEVPITTDLSVMETTLQEFVSQIHGSWTWQGREVAGKRLLDVVITRQFDWKSLLPVGERVYSEDETPIDPGMQALIDSLGWRLVACWTWDGITKDRNLYDDSDPLNPVLVGVERAVVRLFPTPTGDPLTEVLYADILNYMNDDVTFDADGNEVSRTRPTAPLETHSWGWPRRT